MTKLLSLENDLAFKRIFETDKHDPPSRLELSLEETVLEAVKLEGIKQGEEKEKVSIALKLLAAGVSLETIAMATGLVVSDIQKLSGNSNGK